MRIEVMHEFSTRSSPKKNVITIICVFALMFALAFFGLTIALATWIFFEAILLAVFFIVLLLVKKTYWKIFFRGNVLFLVNNGNGQGYTFEALKAEDFKITQSEAQKAKNTCDMRVSDAPFAMYDIENCDELKAYIKANFN
ncbi:MAG: hypothetical protein IJW76_00215 [Clostridia bacterium]|nr:hypothetical protein [Clostridia bacterium]